MAIMRLSNAELHFGSHAILDGVDFVIEKGERIGLLGRNGVGKTTLFRVLSGEHPLDDGSRWIDPAIRLARLEQELPIEDDTRVFDWVAGGLTDIGELFRQYEALASATSDSELAEMARIQQAIEAKDGWRLQTQVETTLTQLGLDGDRFLKDLSGGWRRRVALARALVSQPDLLLLDEPTNHLDIPTIEWLEVQLAQYKGALVVITHDRRFLQAVANRIGELDRGKLSLWTGSYRDFMRHRNDELEAEAKAEALFDKRLAQEEVWIRQGIKARRTRNEGRVRRLEAMRQERASRRHREGRANIQLDNSVLSGKLVAELTDVDFQYGDKPVLTGLNTLIQRGDRVGIVGKNGAGKTTLINLILGKLTPTTGTVKLGSKLETAYSDQLRANLNPDQNLIDNICGGQEFIEIGGKKRHAIGYLGDFLFSPDRVRAPAKALSGGERNRAILAKLFTQPANLLVLDEPTNDLDIETLELLEEVLLEYTGTVLLVSHDRDFMDKVVTSLLVINDHGVVDEQAGGFSDWEARGGGFQRLSVEDRVAAAPSSTTDQKPAKQNQQRSARKLSYKEQRELDQLPAQIEALEADHLRLMALTETPDFYTRDSREVNETLTELASAGDRLDAALERLIELEDSAS